MKKKKKKKRKKEIGEKYLYQKSKNENGWGKLENNASSADYTIGKLEKLNSNIFLPS